MSSKPFWINEGYVLDDAGNMIVTSYVDLREDGKRTPIPALVKGCRREHALEDGERILVSKPARFREYGVGLIQDEQEGFAKEEFVAVMEETAARAARRRAIADMNEAQELLDSRIRMTRKETYSSKRTANQHLAYGNEWWIFCTSIAPRDDELETWKATLDEEYDHVSEIGQPAKFAEALARMVTEQIGPQGKDGWFEETTEGAEGARTKHRTQWVVHGPVVYTNRLYETLTRDRDEWTRLAASVFTKDSTYAGQREYRFVVLNEGAAEETVLLNISGMMRDALKRTEGGLIRGAPARAETAGDGEVLLSSRTRVSREPRYKRSMATERHAQSEEWRWETRGADGRIMSSERKRREEVKERIVAQEHGADGEDTPATMNQDQDDGEATWEHPVPEVAPFPVRHGEEQRDEEAVQELVPATCERAEGERESAAMTLAATGRAYKSFEEMFNDPAAPVSPSAKTWQESACSLEENAKSYGFVDCLAFKVTQVNAENRRDAASASWHAVQCIRNIYARLGDIVGSVCIERERFVVIRLTQSNKPGAKGRIVISPSGSYDYCFQLQDTEESGQGEVALGVMFFPMPNDVEKFEEFGWPGKAS